MSKKYRFILFLLSFSILIFIGLIIKKDISFLITEFWFSSGLLLLILLSLIDQPHFSKDSNIVVNSITAAISLLLVKNADRDCLFWLFTGIVLYLVISSYCLVWIRNNPLNEEKRIVQFISRINRQIGKPETIFSAFFLWGAIKQFSLNSNEFNLLLWYWIFFMLLNIPQLASTLENLLTISKIKLSENIIGEIFGVQSKKVFLIKLYETRNKSIKRFDIIKLRYSMLDANDLSITGIVFDTYLLNKEKWAKVLQLNDPQKEKDVSKLEKNIAYKITDTDELRIANKELKIDEFVGIVVDGSTIGRIKFEYSKKIDDLQEGDLLELKSGGTRLFYQVISGCTEKEKLEARNESGFIEGEAIQLGEWKTEKLSFQKYGWVPSINTPIFKANTSNITLNDFSYPDFKIGNIPGTSLPSIINLKDAVSHHIALLGVTGSGKSYLAKLLIDQLLIDTKIICIDFTGEWKKCITDYEIINKTNIQDYLTNSSGKIAIFELQSISNTTDVLKETQASLEKIFTFAKNKYDHNEPVNILLILEEAHTITPETNFLGDMGDYGGNKATVNKMTQVALQGRKYGVGLMVIAQRTANVSKTVLTQCNTVICFQAFDETSFTFLGNYVGKDMIQALPNLKQYHAVVAGKASKSNMPMIVDLTR